MSDLISMTLASMQAYFGADWGATISSFLQLYFLGSNKRIGFVFGVAASVFWFIFGYMTGSIATMIAQVIFGIINIRGLIVWDQKRKTS